MIYLFYTFYFILFKVVPLSYITQYLVSDTLAERISTDLVQQGLRFAFFSSIVEKHCTLSVLLNWRNRKNSQKVMSREQPGCGITLVLCFAKNCRMSKAGRACALSQGKIHELFLQKSDHLLRFFLCKFHPTLQISLPLRLPFNVLSIYPCSVTSFNAFELAQAVRTVTYHLFICLVIAT